MIKNMQINCLFLASGAIYFTVSDYNKWYVEF